MAKLPHLLVAISAHGYGHISQIAPIVYRLRHLRPELRLTVMADIPRDVLAQYFDAPWDHLSIASDIGMVMTSALDVQPQASADAYREFHRDWGQKIARAAQTLQSLSPNLVLANAPYLPLAAAAHAGIPAVALSSLNWADMYQHYCGEYPEAVEIHAQIIAAYNSASAFLRLTPGMPMNNLTRCHVIGPVARLGRERREEIQQRLALHSEEKIVLVNFGGIPIHINREHWPSVPGVCWLVPQAWKPCRPGEVAVESLGMPFQDLMRSCHGFIGKPGYGAFCEAACNGIPVLYVRRGHWPEERYLIEWLERQGRCLEIEREELRQGALADPLERLFALPEKPRVAPVGIDDAVDFIVRQWF